MSKEYSKLSQNERDLESINYMVKPQENQRKNCCFNTFVVLVVIVMLCGGAAIVVGIFFTPQVNNIIDNFRKPTNSSSNNSTNTAIPVQQNITTTTTTAKPLSITTAPHLKQNETLNSKNITKTNIDSTVTEDEESSEVGDEEDEETATISNSVKHVHHKSHTSNDTREHGFLYTITGDDKFMDETEEEFATGMIKLERFLEKITGIRRPEFVVPLFMLFCFIISLSLASCCCYLLMKRRDSKRRRTIGKMITDLQTGDSKSILLDQDGDD